MLLNDDQLAQFAREGFIALPGLFTPDEVSVLRREATGRRDADRRYR